MEIITVLFLLEILEGINFWQCVLVNVYMYISSDICTLG